MDVALSIHSDATVVRRSELLPVTLKPAEKREFKAFADSYDKSASSMAREIILTAMKSNPPGPHT